MDTASLAYVLLENVEALSQAGARTAQTGCLGTACRTDGAQSKKLLAPLQNDGHAKRYDPAAAGLKAQGLISVREQWIAFHYPASNQSGKPVS